jgi:3-methylfumaryl-CoA hydratase
MTVTTPIDVDALRAYIGRHERSSDELTPRVCRELCATLGESADGPAPLGAHWCLFPAIVPAAGLGNDGHPQRGRFLPPVALPRRMWASGALRILDRLRVGDRAERNSRIADVSVKEGRSGKLCFVVVEHEISTERGLAIKENQQIVYRAAAVGGASGAPVARDTVESPVEGRAIRTILIDAVRLFRYSAVTFNGHRIHYDRAYATGTEGYPGLVVHAPLQASLLLELATQEHGGQSPHSFSFRALRPVFEGPVTLYVDVAGETMRLWTAGPDRLPAMAAVASW